VGRAAGLSRPEYKGPHGDHLTPSNFRENLIGATLCVFAVIFGIFPYELPGGQPSVLKYMDRTINQQVRDLTTWTEANRAPRPAPAAPAPATQPASLPAIDSSVASALPKELP
jgi:hypothetical protein